MRSQPFASFSNHARFIIREHGHVSLNRLWRGKNISTQANILFLVKAGSGVYVYNGKTTLLTPGHAYLFPRGAVVGFSCGKFLEKFYVHFQLELNPLLDLFDFMPHRAYSLPLEGHEFTGVSPFSGGDMGGFFAAETALRLIVSRFLSLGPKTPVSLLTAWAKYAPIYQYLEQHLGIDLSVGKLAALLGMTEAHLSRRFKKDTGVNLKNLVICKVLERAKQDLRHSRQKVKEIAEALHFEDHLYFSKFFKTHCGLSPLQYRMGTGVLP